MPIIIPGIPIAKKRPRFARRGKFVTTYSDQQTEEGRFYLEAKQQICCKALNGTPVHIKLTFEMPRPKSHYGTGRNAGKLKPSAPEEHTSKPDLDNLIKFVFDCLNGLAWVDDTQVIGMSAEKIYALDGEPKTIIGIR